MPSTSMLKISGSEKPLCTCDTERIEGVWFCPVHGDCNAAETREATKERLMRWKYLTVRTVRLLLDHELNDYGSQSWELICVERAHATMSVGDDVQCFYYIFKQPTI